MKIVEAKRSGAESVTVWGSGSQFEWLVDDGAGMIGAIDVKPNIDPINIGVGKGISIWDLAP